jgi:hypothetical protein
MKTVWLLLIPLIALASEPVLVSETKLADTPNRFVSPNREFAAEFEYAQGNSEFVPITRFSLQDKTGRTLYTKADFKHTLADIADNGVVVGIDFDGPISGRAKLHFYNRSGAELGSADVGFLGARAFSANSAVYCVNDGLRGVRVFDLSGRELFSLGKANWFAVSADGRTIALAQDDGIALFAEGKPAGRIAVSSPFIRQMKFSPDGSLLGYVDRKILKLYRTSDRNLVFEYRVNQPELNVVSLDIAADNSQVLAGLDEDKGRGAIERHVRGYVYLFDRTGKRSWQHELSYSKWNAFVPDVSFGPDQRFRVNTAEQVYEFRY